MSESIVLSLIFTGIVALIGYIGATVGVARGFVLTTAVLLGAEVALWWGDRIGNRLSDWFSTAETTSRFLAAMLMLLALTLSLGIAGSAVLAWGTPTRWGAVLGGLLGAANGALLISMALRLYYLAYSGELTSDPLDDSIFTRVLWSNFDWFVLGVAVVATMLLLYTRFSSLSLTVPEPSARANFVRPVPPPVARPDSSVQRVRDARPLDVSPATSSPSSNGRSTEPSAPMVDDQMYAPPRVTRTEPSQTSVERAPELLVQEARSELPSARNVVRFCPNCGMTLDASDRFCPDCGYTL